MGDRISAATKRLKGVQIDNRPAVQLIREHCYANTLIYADPPYPLSARNIRLYSHEMSDEDHEKLLDALLQHSGPVILSSYNNGLYDRRLSSWYKSSTNTLADGCRIREEVLWCNRPFPHRQVNIFDVIEGG